MKLLLSVLLAVFSLNLTPSFAEEVTAQSPETVSAEEGFETTAMLNCHQIRTYCYNMWIIRRRNYPQYVGCVYSNAENNNLSCNP